MTNGKDTILLYLGYPGHKGTLNQGMGNNSGFGNWDLEFKTIAWTWI